MTQNEGKHDLLPLSANDYLFLFGRIFPIDDNTYLG